MPHAFDHPIAADTPEFEELAPGNAQAVVEPGAKQCSRAVEPDSNRFFGEVQRPGHFPAREFLDVAQDEDGAVVLGQRIDDRFQRSAELVPQCPVLGGVGVVVECNLAMSLVQSVAGLARTIPAHRFAADDCRQPGRQTRVAAKLCEVSVRLQVGLLHRVLGFMVVPCDAPRDAEQAAVVAPHQHGKPLGLPAEDSGDERLVWGIGRLGK